ncbi:hypothetical protein K461DRAFT_315530 [Myriangium duriaei CBS 260.36]|uniref:Uncharacterized protein n=1 Tax=Myriangium duriaei CBS 260.36 TaxID=1168546 RepID=A0A9P4IT51_9PEZI|nr:hypothetical protein K461DRAFT_315530 [Myriangium duriaei CBS 260.36]
MKSVLYSGVLSTLVSGGLSWDPLHLLKRDAISCITSTIHCGKTCGNAGGRSTGTITITNTVFVPTTTTPVVYYTPTVTATKYWDFATLVYGAALTMTTGTVTIPVTVTTSTLTTITRTNVVDATTTATVYSLSTIQPSATAQPQSSASIPVQSSTTVPSQSITTIPSSSSTTLISDASTAVGSQSSTSVQSQSSAPVANQRRGVLQKRYNAVSIMCTSTGYTAIYPLTTLTARPTTQTVAPFTVTVTTWTSSTLTNTHNTIATQVTTLTTTNTIPIYKTVTSTSYTTATTVKTALDTTTVSTSVVTATVTTTIANYNTHEICGTSTAHAKRSVTFGHPSSTPTSIPQHQHDVITSVTTSTTTTTVSTTATGFAKATASSVTTVNGQTFGVFTGATLLNSASHYLKSCKCSGGGLFSICAYGNVAGTCKAFSDCTALCSRIGGCKGTAYIAGYCNFLSVAPLVASDSCAATGTAADGVTVKK